MDAPSPPSPHPDHPIARRGKIQPGVAVAVLLLISFAAAGWWLFRGDAIYWWMENRPGSAFREFDGLIGAVAERHGVDPHLLKALVWQESRFDPRATGAAGERGLMQVTEIAAEDWVRADQIETFAPADLFDPHTNLEVGTWYLARALRRHENQSDPVPFALAEYNAGASRVNRWMALLEEIPDPKAHSSAAPAEFVEAIDFPTTRQYILRIQARRDFYRRRGDFPAK